MFKYLILSVNISVSYAGGDDLDPTKEGHVASNELEKIYNCCRGEWKISQSKWSEIDFVVAQVDKKSIEVFKPIEWYQAKRGSEFSNFNGEVIQDQKLRRFILENALIAQEDQGMQNPFRYSIIEIEAKVRPQ